METETANHPAVKSIPLPNKVSFSYMNLMTAVLCFSFPLIGSGRSDFSWVLYLLGVSGLFFAELGNTLATDYYAFRQQGSKEGQRITDWIKPELLVLKGSWGSYLVALLFVLLLSQSLGWAGWKVTALSVAGFFTGYYASANPFYWNRSFLGRLFSALSPTWVPFLASCIIFDIDFNYLLLIALFSFYVFIVVRGLALERSQGQRYTDRDFPSYKFVPGLAPHPHRDPAGHSYGLVEPAISKTQPEYWKKTELYLYGVDLFNAGYYWEAHEAWETLWKVLEPNSDHAIFLQGLIQVAAASLKYRLNNKEGVVRLFQQATEKLMKVQKSYSEPYMGLDLSKFLPQVMKAFASIQYVKDGEVFPAFRPIVLRLEQ